MVEQEIINNRWLNYRKKFKNDTPLTVYQKNVLCGILLGDASLQYMSKGSRTPILTTTHTEKHKNYSELISKIFNGRCYFRERFDKRTNKTYKSYEVTTQSHLEFIDIYNKLYFDRVKEPSKEFLEYFNDVSLAFWFMDDGYTCHDTFFLCTDCFSKDTCLLLIKTVKEKFGIEFRLAKHGKNYRLRLRFDDREKFVNIIEPHMVDIMKYKINIQIIDKPHRNNIRLTTEEFIRRAKEVHGDKYDYSKVVYKNNHTDVCIICPKHGEFLQTPQNHIDQKHGCRECGKERTLEYNKNRGIYKENINKND